MLKFFAFVLLAAVTAVLTLAALKPANYTIWREAKIAASPEKIFPLINDARAMDRWMPWAEMDPQMTMSYSGPSSGVGSKASWTSPGRMGVGSSTITRSVENRSASYLLEYVKPFAMKQTAEISIQPSGGSSVIVRWSVSGHSPFFARVMCLFMNMDKMVGSSFEAGLAKLKSIAESR